MANPEEMYQCQTVNCGCIYNPDKGDRKGKGKAKGWAQSPADKGQNEWSKTQDKGDTTK